MNADPNRPDLPRLEHSSREQPVYRPSRGGMDPATKRLSIIAGGIGVVLLALVGGWSLMGHHAGGIPVIEPPSGPERVKPAEPGGLQLMGADPPPSTADAAGGATLAPAPEKPDPAALQDELARAQREAAATEPAPSPAAAPAATPTATPATPAPAPAGSKAPAPPPPPAAREPAPAVLSAGGRVEVQLAAMDTEALAQAEWTRLTRKDPALFADRKPVIIAASRDGKTFYRLRTGGFSTVADATGFCERSRAAGAACTIASF